MRDLERRYRRLLCVFPPSYREFREEEILGTLLDAAGPSRRWPGIRETWDLVRAGVRTRWRLATGGSLGRTICDGLRWGALVWLVWKAVGVAVDAFFAIRWAVVASVSWDGPIVPFLMFLLWSITLVLVMAAPRVWALTSLLLTIGIVAAGETFRMLSYSGPVRPLWIIALVLPQLLPLLALLLPGSVNPWRKRATRVWVALAIVAVLAAGRLLMHFFTGGTFTMEIHLHRWQQMFSIVVIGGGLLLAWMEPRLAFVALLLAANNALRQVLFWMHWSQVQGGQSLVHLLGAVLPPMLVLALGYFALRWSRQKIAV